VDAAGDFRGGGVPFAGVRDGKLPDVRLFLSCGGTGDLEKRLLAGTLEMVDRLKRAGFPEDRMEVHVEGWAEHNEESWERMVPRMLKFFFGRR
jgi:hypothetical protein